MKKQILVWSALIIAALFTACEQNAVIEPLNDTSQINSYLETPVPLEEIPAEFKAFLESEEEGNNLESRCDSYPHSSASVHGPIEAEVTANNFCSSKFRFGASTNYTYGGRADYYVIIEQGRTNGGSYFDLYPHTNKFYLHWESPYYIVPTFGNDDRTCQVRTRVYVRDKNCDTFKKLLDRQFSL